MTASSRIVQGRKFMWDGRAYASAEEAEQAKKGYEADGFETWTGQEDGSFLVYTRRAVAATAGG
jgi:hypothetical protein